MHNNRLKIGLDKYGKIYVAINRYMYDLFFTEKEDSINCRNINFNEGKENNKKTVNENYKLYFDIPLDGPNKSTKKILNDMPQDNNLTIEQLIQSKMKNIISKIFQRI